MIEMIEIIMVFWAWVCTGNVIYFIAKRHCHFKKHHQPGNAAPSDQVVIIESVKGFDKNFKTHVNALIHQDHPCFRIIFCLSDKKDPAFKFLAGFFKQSPRDLSMAYHISQKSLSGLTLGSHGLQSVEIVVAGRAQTCSQKIFNQLKAYGQLLPQDRMIAWVDADTDLTASWLCNLLAPIQGKTMAASTGYRCLVPEGHNWSSALTSVMNSSILTLLGDPWRNSFWGGSMAMTRAVFEKYKIPEYVGRCFSDDESLAALLKKNGVPIYFCFDVLPPGKINYTIQEMFNFGRRQYMCARLYYKFHVFIACLLLGGFFNTFFLLLIKIIVWQASFDIVLFIGLTTAMVVRGVFRFCFIRYTLKRSEYGGKCLFLETFGTPLVHLAHLSICLAAMAGQRVEWAGIKYKIKGPFNVKVL